MHKRERLQILAPGLAPRGGVLNPFVRVFVPPSRVLVSAVDVKHGPAGVVSPVAAAGADEGVGVGGKSGVQHPRVTQCLSRWMKELDLMCAENPALDVSEERDALLHGVKVVLDGEPRSERLRNTPTVRRYLELVLARLEEYADKGAVEELPQQPALVQPLHVIVRVDRKPRLVLDLSQNLNEFIEDEHIRVQYEDLRVAVRCSRARVWYGKHDVSDCYLSFPVALESRRFLAFGLNGKWYRFVRLPFGLASAPRTCTKLLDVVSHALRAAGIEHVRYLDDFLYFADTEQQLRHNMEKADSIIQQFGLVVNGIKTVHASQCIEFLGVLLDSIACTLSCTPARIQELRSIIDSVLVQKFIGVNALRSLIGKFSFAAQVLPGARPYMRRLIDQLYRSRVGSALLAVNSAMRADLQFWKEHLQVWNGKCRWVAESPVLVIATDASLTGFGGVVEADLTAAGTAGHAWRGKWSGVQSHQVRVAGDIVYAEMFAALFALFRVAQSHRTCTVQLVMDSATSVAVVNAWATRSTRVAGLLRQMALIAMDSELRVVAVHRAGVDNIWPDALSRYDKHRNRSLAEIAADRSVIPVSCVGGVSLLSDVESSQLVLHPQNDVRS